MLRRGGAYRPDRSGPGGPFGPFGLSGCGHDEEGRTFHLVYTECAVLSVTDPALAGQPFLAAPNEMEAFLAGQLTAAQQAGDTAPGLDARQETVVLLALSAGLGLSVLLGQRSADDATAVLRYHLGRLFPAPAAAPQDGGLAGRRKVE
ncbi:TetR family transcriptional regulator [Kitasatospora cineracea]|uniref:TetR family transcriptional regulator n=2 Tax=Kitasatospora cineracea TaxID=88074 RepID=A0A3N4R791_9ACTN|nr:TetR family transcriptional regulator C-terminal domain-containing protein [Kitasatospora cineracea]RPE29403.1 TetR family transcriptional regulator [Kitasatospora cineracea]